jgi:hypothetical protein
VINITKSVLITRPNYDPITHYLNKWSEQFIVLARDRNMRVHDLSSTKANRADVISRLEKQEYDLVIFNGHGSYTQIAGHSDEILIESRKNHKLLKNKIIYCLSCSSAKILGKDCVEDGAKGFIGYEEKFAFVNNNNMVSRPLADKYAKSILTPTNQIPIALLKGHTLSEAMERAEKSYVDEIIRLQNSESEPGASSLAMVLMCNASILKKHGQDDATI